MKIKNTHIVFIPVFCLWINTQAQSYQIIYQPDVIKQVMANMAEREAHISLLTSSLNKTKEYKQKTVEMWGVVTDINTKIYHNLNEVLDGIKNGKMMMDIGKRIPEIISHVTEAGEIASGKPYLILVWNQSGRLLVDRSLALYADVNKIVMSSNKNILIDQATRDVLLYKVWREITILDNLSQTMVYQFKMYILKTAIGQVFPYQFYINLDKSVVTRTIQTLKL